MNQSRPTEPINECRECEPMLAAYVDGETAACDCSRLLAHVQSCACCRDRLAGERAAREAVRARRDRLRACASPGLKARCAAVAAAPAVPGTTAAGVRPTAVTPRQGPVAFVRRWAPLSVAATLVLAVAVVFGFGLTNQGQALAFQSTLDHVKCSRLLPQTAHADPIASARQWQTTYGWPLIVPPSSAGSQLELRAVRRCAVTDGRVAHLIYSWMGEPLSVFVLPKRTLGEAAEFVTRFRHNSVMWSENDRTYIIVTPHRRDPELDQVVAYVRAKAF